MDDVLKLKELIDVDTFAPVAKQLQQKVRSLLVWSQLQLTVPQPFVCGQSAAAEGAVLLTAANGVLLISDGGTLVRTRASEISRVSRNTQGVTLIRLGKGEQLVSVEAVPPEEDDGAQDTGQGEDQAS